MRSYSNLPEDIIVDILSRLPAKSVGQCRCLSKAWRTLLSEPHFIRNHLHWSIILRQESLLFFSNSGGSLVSASLSNDYHLFDQITISPTRLSFPGHPGFWAWFHGSCDGLLLVGDKFKKFVVNPITREIREVPQSPFALEPHACFTSYRLGYDSVHDDYKIVTLSSHVVNKFTGILVDCNEMFFDVYSLKTGSWKRAESFPCDHSLIRYVSGVFVNGSIHWLAKTRDCKYAIMAFDLAEEKHHEVPPLSSVGSDKFVFTRCTVLGGCLCISIEDGPDLWVMKEYGVKESWTKLAIHVHNYPHWYFLDEERVVMKDKRYVIYNLTMGTLKDIVIDGYSNEVFLTGRFFNTPISPHGSNEIVRE